MPRQRDPEEPARDASTERRHQARDDEDSTNWETIALRRVARHVESLSGDPDSPADPSHDRGWEEAALRALRRRIQGLRSK